MKMQITYQFHSSCQGCSSIKTPPQKVPLRRSVTTTMKISSRTSHLFILVLLVAVVISDIDVVAVSSNNSQTVSFPSTLSLFSNRLSRQEQNDEYKRRTRTNEQQGRKGNSSRQVLRRRKLGKNNNDNNDNSYEDISDTKVEEEVRQVGLFIVTDSTVDEEEGEEKEEYPDNEEPPMIVLENVLDHNDEQIPSAEPQQAHSIEVLTGKDGTLIIPPQTIELPSPNNLDDVSQQQHIEALDEGNAAITVTAVPQLNAPGTQKIDIVEEVNDENKDDSEEISLAQVMADNIDTIASLPGDPDDGEYYIDMDEDIVIPENLELMTQDAVPTKNLDDIKTIVDGKITFLDKDEDNNNDEEQKAIREAVLSDIGQLSNIPVKSASDTEKEDKGGNNDEYQQTDGGDLDQGFSGKDDSPATGSALAFALKEDVDLLEDTILAVQPNLEEEEQEKNSPPPMMARARSSALPGDTDETTGVDLTQEVIAEGEVEYSLLEENVAEEAEGPIEIALDYDEEKFEFLDPTQIQPGKTTCGFLHAPLGYIPGEDFATIKVYFCIRFANVVSSSEQENQWLAVHCGGPGTLSDCSTRMEGSYLSSKILDTYHVISFDQRGLGRSWPNFAHEECTFGVTKERDALRLDPRDMELMEEDEDIIGYHVDGVFIDSINLEDEKQIDEYLEQSENRALTCWTCTKCDFHFQSVQTKEKYHFLDYSGTQQVAQDLNYFRQVFNIDKLSLLGASYGTQIFMVYSSLYEEHIDKLVLDASMSPIIDWTHVGTTFVQSLDERFNYLNYSCRMKHKNFNLLKDNKIIDLDMTPKEESDCPVKDLGKCFENVINEMQNEIQRKLKDSFSLSTARENLSIAKHLLYMSSYDDPKIYLKELCEAAEDDPKRIPAVLHNYVEHLTTMRSQQNESTSNTEKGEEDNVRSGSSSSSRSEPCISCPTSISKVYGNKHYPTLMGQNGYYSTTLIPESLILAQTLAGNIHDMSYIKRQIKEIMKQYPGLGTHEPARRYLFLMGLAYGWPETHPVSPPINFNQKGLITSQLYDPSTPYVWTQEVKLHAFPSMTLMTSQWLEHGFVQHELANVHNTNDRDVSGTTSDTIKEVGDIDERSNNASIAPIQHDNDCFHHILNYLETGEINIDDGTVCRTGYHNLFDYSSSSSEAAIGSVSAQPLVVIDKDTSTIIEPSIEQEEEEEGEKDDAEILIEILSDEEESMYEDLVPLPQVRPNPITRPVISDEQKPNIRRHRHYRRRTLLQQTTF